MSECIDTVECPSCGQYTALLTTNNKSGIKHIYCPGCGYDDDKHDLATEELTFKCPECGHDTIETLESTATLTHEITAIKADGNHELATPVVEDSTIDEIHCFKCGYIIRDEHGDYITDFIALVKWIREHTKA